MSHRTLLEVNHDYIADLDIGDIGRSLRASGLVELPYGVVKVGERHHSDPEWRQNDPQMRETLAELLRLYDLRQDLAAREKAGTIDAKELKKALVRYGREKKAAWDAARRHLNGKGTAR